MNVKKLFIDYFKNNGHEEYPSSSLIPNNDKSLLFVNSGMVQFKDIFLGNLKPSHKAIVTCQKCMRAGGKHNDLDNIGFTSRHHSFFEMLGNFSFGDYFKDEAIFFAWDFLINHLKLDKDRLYVSVHDSDQASKDIWINKIKIDSNKVLVLGDEDNFWQMGDTGPCGPCTEIYYDLGDEYEGVLPSLGDPKDRYIEIWNLVFTQYNKTEDGSLEELPQKCVDTGMGLERVQSIVEGYADNYDSSIFKSLSEFIESKIKINTKNIHIKKILLDHIRACCHLINDNVIPDRDGRGYVLRRILRRAIRHGYKLGATESFLMPILNSLAKNMQDAYPELLTNIKKIEKTTLQEEDKFFETIANGMSILEQEINLTKKNKSTILNGSVAFKLHDTFGFPIDLTADICREHDITIDQAGFDQDMAEQKNKAKNASQFKAKDSIVIDIDPTKFLAYTHNEEFSTIESIILNNEPAVEVSANNACNLVVKESPFYAESGGQVGDTGKIFNDQAEFIVHDTQKLPNGVILHIGELVRGQLKIKDPVLCQVDHIRRDSIKRNHSATHLLHKALKTVLGDHVEQKGSLVNELRTRFDFSHSSALSETEIQQVEQIVNNEILQNNPTSAEVMDLDKAKKSGAMMLFGEKYDDEVRVLTIGNSKELCGGTHVNATGDIGLFKILNESGISSGVRRIEATTGISLIQIIDKQNQLLNATAKELKTTKDDVAEKIKQVIDQVKTQEKTIAQLKQKITNASKNDLLGQIEVIDGTKVLSTSIDNMEIPQLRSLIDDLKNNIGSGIIILATINQGKINIAVGVTKDITNQFHAGKIAGQLANMVGGNGGGKPDMAMAGGQNINDLPEALIKIKKLLNS